MDDKKEAIKVQIRMDSGQLKKLDASFEAAGFHSRNEYICKAIDFYSSFLETKQAEDYLSKTLMVAVDKRLKSMEGRELKEMEDRLAMLSYKIAVELAQINLTLAELSDYSYEDAQALRGDAVQMVNLSKGFITLPMACRSQRNKGSG